ncbi:MAG: hypothetical protein H7A47_08690 [Verrucomicrobiales bacterium]|nr:hypothetical protein [Verrucomicrobiales bacterium]
MRRKTWWWVAAGGLVVLLIPCLVVMEEHYAGRRAWRSFLGEMERVGVGVTLDQVPAAFAVPQECAVLDQLTVLSLLQVREPVHAGGTWPGGPVPQELTGPGRAVACWQMDRVLLEDGSRMSWDEVRRAFGPTTVDLMTLRRRLLQEPIAFRPSLEDLTYGPQGAFAWISVARHFNARVGIELSAGDLPACQQTLVAAARLARGTVPSNVRTGYIGFLSVGHISLRVLWAALQYPGWTEAELARLQGEWAVYDPVGRLPVVVLGERAVRLDQMQRADAFKAAMPANLIPKRNPFATYTGPITLLNPIDAVERVGAGLREWAFRAGMASLRTAWLDHNRALCARLMQTNVVAARRLVETRDARVIRPLTSALDERDAGLSDGQRAASLRHPRSLLCAGTRFSMTSTMEAAARLATVHQITLTAIALKRFHLAQGRWPESLEELVPDLLPAIPRDWMDGQPLRYRSSGAEEFLLYSVGEDGVDDGGDPGEPPDSTMGEVLQGRDWVWPRPGVSGLLTRVGPDSGA